MGKCYYISFECIVLLFHFYAGQFILMHFYFSHHFVHMATKRHFVYYDI